MMANNGSWIISMPCIGVSTGTISTEKVIEFLNEEISFFQRLQFNNNVVFANTNYGELRITERATRELSAIVEAVRAGKTDALDRYVAAGNARSVLVGASAIGKTVERLKESSPSAAFILACIFSSSWSETSHSAARDIIAIFRGIAFANPANESFDNLVEANAVAKQADDAWKSSKTEASKLESYIEEKTKLFETLEDLYRKKLTIQEPAISWENIANKKALIWKLWLTVFAVLAIAPFLTAVLHWESISAAVGKITAGANGNFSLTGLAVVTIPALFYAWLLKNISRVFIQNLNLADDAHHRRSLALTYMGLLQDDKRPTSDADRAIVLNALFRPIPPQTNDEGPPAGIIELIKKG